MRAFNRGLAIGDCFCNRKKEIDVLKNNIKSHTHTVLISPRRYGKTSLVIKVLEQENYVYAHIDLFMKYNREAIIQEFYDRVGQLMSKLMNPTKKALQKIEAFFQQVKVALRWGEAGLEFSLSPYSNKKQSLKVLMESLDEFLKKEKKKIVIFIDELQTIVDSEIQDEFEADLRFIAQKTTNIVFIFSGSHRHLVSQIFEDRSRPFYKLCYPLYLRKIENLHYHKHLAGFAKEKWNKKMSEESLQTITELTLCHPYYYNVLCEKLFRLDEVPSQDTVLAYWKQVCVEEQSSIGKDLEFLTAKQQQLLAALAKNPGISAPTSKSFLSHVRLTAKGVLDAIQVLSRHDLIERDEEGCMWIVDPVMAYWAQR